MPYTIGTQISTSLTLLWEPYDSQKILNKDLSNLECQILRDEEMDIQNKTNTQVLNTVARLIGEFHAFTNKNARFNLVIKKNV